MELADICVGSDQALRTAVDCINHSGVGIALVMDADQHLVGTITDGDVRRFILAGYSFDNPIADVLVRKQGTQYARPVTATVGTGQAQLAQLMRDHFVRQIPLLDSEGRVISLVTWNELLPAPTLNVSAVIMAGGAGRRLRPLTDDVPKPMLPVGNRPLLEHLVEQLRTAGIGTIYVATHYLSEKIKAHFGDGSRFGVRLSYLREQQPLGTAGALGQLPDLQDPILVVNGDILTRLDFRRVFAFHQDQEALMTVAVRKYEFDVPYGVVDSDGVHVLSLVEKPRYTVFVNAGIYLLEPAALRYVPSNEPFDMTDLIQRLISENLSVVSFPIHEYWMDIGQRTDYEQVQHDIRDGRISP